MDFSSDLHPRDRLGRWRDELRAIEREVKGSVPYGPPHRTGDVPAAEVAALRHLRPGQSLVLPHGTEVRRPFTDLELPREYGVELPGRTARARADNAAALGVPDALPPKDMRAAYPASGDEPVPTPGRQGDYPEPGALPVEPDPGTAFVARSPGRAAGPPPALDALSHGIARKLPATASRGEIEALVEREAAMLDPGSRRALADRVAERLDPENPNATIVRPDELGRLPMSPGRSRHNASLGRELADAEREHREARIDAAGATFEPHRAAKVRARLDRAQRRLERARNTIRATMHANALGTAPLRESLFDEAEHPRMHGRFVRKLSALGPGEGAHFGGGVRAYRLLGDHYQVIKGEHSEFAHTAERAASAIARVRRGAGTAIPRMVPIMPASPGRARKPEMVGDIFTAIDQAVEVVRARREGREPHRLYGAPALPAASPGRAEPPFPSGGVSIISGAHRMGPYGTWDQLADQLLRERASGSTSARAVTGADSRGELTAEQAQHLVELAARKALGTQEARRRERAELAALVLLG